MAVRKFSEATGRDCIRRIAEVAKFLGRSTDTATADDVRRFQVHMSENGARPAKVNSATSGDPAKLACLADPRVKASQETLRQALRGRVTKSHRFLLRLHLGQIDALDAAIALLDREVEASIEPFRIAVEQVSTIPGVKDLSARTIFSEIGIDMGQFPSDAI